MISLTERLLWCDERFAVVNKLPGEMCSSEDGTFNESLYIPQVFRNEIEKKLNRKPELIECVNRIDRPVSGIVLIALTENSQRELKKLFSIKEKVGKKYWAIIEGVSKSDDNPVTLKNYMYFNPSKQKSYICEKEHRKSKYAELSYTVKGAGERYSYLEIKLVTGRTHQIRAQLSNSGFHIRGDLKYGARRSDTIPGIRLHAAYLEFEYPGDRKYSFKANVPEVDALWKDALSVFTPFPDETQLHEKQSGKAFLRKVCYEPY